MPLGRPAAQSPEDTYVGSPKEPENSLTAMHLTKFDGVVNADHTRTVLGGRYFERGVTTTALEFHRYKTR